MKAQDKKLNTQLKMNLNDYFWVQVVYICQIGDTQVWIIT
ncbi:MAG: hypothetical protein JWR54_1800 [Mucilaginibacter sp.]|nr:hypothetical protein [Mucilaginibacter sp.]